MSKSTGRKHFLTFAALAALSVGSITLITPQVLLASKGVAANAAAAV